MRNIRLQLTLLQLFIIISFSPQNCVYAAPSDGQGSAAVTQKAFVGAVTDRYPLRMTLQVERQKLEGSYFFLQEVPYSPREFILKGTRDPTGRVVLNEMSYDGKTGAEKGTKIFEGKADGSFGGEGSPLRLSGTWFGWDKDNPQPFSLVEQPFRIGGDWKLITRSYSAESKQKNTTIGAEFPQFVGGRDVRVARLNRQVEALVLKIIGTFKKLGAEAIRDQVQISPDTGKPVEIPGYSLDISSEVMGASPSLISLEVSEDEFLGGAHGSAFTHTLNYDLKGGRFLQLSDLFKPGTPYLQVISRACIEELRKVNAGLYDEPGAANWLHQGAAPKPENYAAWNITPYGLRFTFQQYQVAAYAFGQGEVIIPFGALQSVLRPEFRGWR